MYQLGPAEIHHVVDLFASQPENYHNLCIIVHSWIHSSMHTLAQYWVGEGRPEGVSAYQMGHYVTVTMEMHGQIVRKSVLQLQREGSLWPWLWKEKARSTV